jgi:hypothetical protein
VDLFETILLRPGSAAFSSHTGITISLFMYSFLSVVDVKMKEPATPPWHGWLRGTEKRTKLVRFSGDGFTFGGQAAHRVANKLLEIRFALGEEITANPGEFVCPAFRHFQGKRLHLPAID